MLDFHRSEARTLSKTNSHYRRGSLSIEYAGEIRPVVERSPRHNWKYQSSVENVDKSRSGDADRGRRYSLGHGVTAYKNESPNGEWRAYRNRIVEQSERHTVYRHTNVRAHTSWSRVRQAGGELKRQTNNECIYGRGRGGSDVVWG